MKNTLAMLLIADYAMGINMDKVGVYAGNELAQTEYGSGLAQTEYGSGLAQTESSWDEGGLAQTESSWGEGNGWGLAQTEGNQFP